MDKETNNQSDHHINPSLLHCSATAKEDSPRKPSGGASAAGDRLKRDEWSEGAVSSLLEAYEGKWVLRNRAKLKGHDWEDVAKYVSSRAGSGKSPKTQTQCKNKIESMKKRYRSESTSAAADASSTWPLYSRLDLLLRGNGPPPPTPTPLPQQPAAPLMPMPMPPPRNDNNSNNNNNNNTKNYNNNLGLAAVMAEPVAVVAAAAAPLGGTTGQNSHGSNGVDRVAKDDGAINKTLLSDHASDKKIHSMEITSDSSTPALYSAEKGGRASRSKTANNKMMNNKKMAKRKRAKEMIEMAESIRWLAEAVVKSEQARMEALTEIERMRAEAEAKRAETDLKRTEIIANTQLEIARLFAGKGVDSSLRIGRN